VGWRVAVVGATGAVGSMLLRVLEERRFPVDGLRLLATARSAGRRVAFAGEELVVEEVGPGSFAGIDICFLAVPGAQASRELAPLAVRAGATVIDKGSAFRMDPAVPLVVPEVNPEAVRPGPGILASPNCTTIPLVLCLAPLRKAFGVRRVIVSTYQSASGTGQAGMEELRTGAEAALRGEPVPARVFPQPLAFNVVPQCDRFGEGGFTQEEWKLVRETRKILGDPDLAISATAVRVPVFVGHSESVYVETERPCDPQEARAVLAAAPGVVVRDDPERGEYPTARDVAGTDLAHVGRIRRDPWSQTGLHFWVVGDNLRKGAATNAVQIAEALIHR
jgi:aspartate-semialdehyde dehydrogenase